MGVELEKLDVEKCYIKINGKNREIRYNFSAWGKLEKEYGGLQNLEKLQKDVEEKPLQMLPHLLYIGLVDKEGVSEDTILDDYGLQDIEYISEVFAKAINGSLPIEEKKTVETVQKKKK